MDKAQFWLMPQKQHRKRKPVEKADLRRTHRAQSRRQTALHRIARGLPRRSNQRRENPQQAKGLFS